MQAEDGSIRSDVGNEREHRRVMQRLRRAKEDENTRELRRKNNSSARRLARSILDEPHRAQIRQSDAEAHRAHPHPQNTTWWDRVAVLNSFEIPEPLGLYWNRKCKNCNIQGLTNERLHDKCFVCGPYGTHYQPPLPLYPDEWDPFIYDRKTANLSRKLNNTFTLTAIAVHDGDLMKFGPGVSAVTLNGAWIAATLAGLQRVNPFIKKLQCLNAHSGDDDIALHLEHSDTNSQEIATIISLAPTSPPSRRKLVIRRKGNDKPIYLDILSPFVEPLHYLFLLPHGTMGWSPARLNAAGKKISQARWYRTRFFMNAEQMSKFSRLTDETNTNYAQESGWLMPGAPLRKLA
ncbi:hypothetical protein DFH08DRAFT_986473 [Mycena albidolilacea]|uniref:Uncharacterized protein n=1 Tax=Mycena albidolilacea TaxID=1033008 RepID=A0AAD6Z1R3_9AGAR|nr:hypothetical protein DFH08DRAFT_986473 [Mycena albidolilacea]